MEWTIEHINQDWLAGSAIAVSAAEVVACFTRCEGWLGHAWIEQTRGNTTGASPTLAVATMGQRLCALEGLSGTAELIDKLRKGDASARAELHALHLLRSIERPETELFPPIKVGAKTRHPDLRVRLGDSPWVYVEVTQANSSEALARARKSMAKLAGTVDRIGQPIALEVFLRREPNPREVECVTERIEAICAIAAPHREYLPDDLGLLFLSDTPPGQIISHDHPGELISPRIGIARVVVQNSEPMRRHISVRLAFSDGRAEEFLTQESKQLPKGGPGLVMINVSGAPGAFKAWEPLLVRRFQPTVHTRVSAVYLFSAASQLTPEGMAVLTQTKLLINPYAATPLPEWIIKALERAGERYAQIAGPRGPPNG